jgi:hypothetical protein
MHSDIFTGLSQDDHLESSVSFLWGVSNSFENDFSRVQACRRHNSLLLTCADVDDLKPLTRTEGTWFHVDDLLLEFRCTAVFLWNPAFFVHQFDGVRDS